MFIDDFTGSEITHDCTALIPTCCPFKLAMHAKSNSLTTKTEIYTIGISIQY